MFHRGFKHSKTIKARLRPRAFISFLVFETPMKHSHSFLKYCVISYVPNQMCFKIVLNIHPCIYAIQKYILFLLSFSDFEFVNAQPMSLRLLKGTFSQQTRGYMGHLTDILAPGGGVINHLLTLGKC